MHTHTVRAAYKFLNVPPKSVSFECQATCRCAGAEGAFKRLHPDMIILAWESE